MPAEDFLAYFASDRSHMLQPNSAEKYIFPGSSWAAICGTGAAAKGVKNNLFDRWLDMRIASDEDSAKEAEPWQEWEHSGSIYGEVFTMHDLEGAVKGKEKATTRQAQPIETLQVPNGSSPDKVLADQQQDHTSLLSNGIASKETAAAIAPPGFLASLPKRQLFWIVLVSLGINFALPFVNGVMLGTFSWLTFCC